MYIFLRVFCLYIVLSGVNSAYSSQDDLVDGGWVEYTPSGVSVVCDGLKVYVLAGKIIVPRDYYLDSEINGNDISFSSSVSDKKGGFINSGIQIGSATNLPKGVGGEALKILEKQRYGDLKIYVMEPRVNSALEINSVVVVTDGVKYLRIMNRDRKFWRSLMGCYVPNVFPPF